ncbi:hypothetical protein Godav_025078 [Gossypium davidsonii]|uniref:Uncharacterized protein n=2 Tax=Gossypium TaxID=3633 RepID=A0A7J8TKC6_GOSDV|nr:hypothetical protein [Gossypium davidsonii]MBA0670682.1 hypothetical protein [Gossypium klotzschianum]
MRLDSYSLLHVREGRFGTYNRRIHGFTSVFEDSSRQNLFKRGKCTDLLEKADEYNGDERALGYSSDQAKGG